MSLKLPLIKAPQPISITHNNNNAEINVVLPSALKAEEEYQEEYDDHYQDDHHQDDHHQDAHQVENVHQLEEEYQQYQHKSPAENVIALKKQQSGLLSAEIVDHHQANSLSNSIAHTLSNNTTISQNASTAIQLNAQIDKNNNAINALRQSISDKKKELKGIGEKVDKDLNKSLLKVGRSEGNASNAYNVREIFSAPPKSNNQNINSYQQELKKVRMMIKRVKGDIMMATAISSDPVSQCNMERYNQSNSKLKELQFQISALNQQKRLLNAELNTTVGMYSFNTGMYNTNARSAPSTQPNQYQAQEQDEQLQKVRQELGEIGNKLKEEKIKLYRLEKEDILMMEKVKYLQESMNVKKPRGMTVDLKQKNVMSNEISETISEINNILEERNKIQSERRMIYKGVDKDVKDIEAKNIDLLNKIRDIESFLLHFYDSKSKKIKEQKETNIKDSNIKDNHNAKSNVKEQSKEQSKDTPLSKSKDSNINTNTAYKSNDKNIGMDYKLVQKRKVYEIGYTGSEFPEAVFNDECFGKNTLSKVHIWQLQDRIVGIQGQYVSSTSQISIGYKMIDKSIISQCKQHILALSAGELITSINYSSKQNVCITYLMIQTSLNQQITIGNDNDNTKESKILKKYESIHLKSKLVQDPVSRQMHLAGISLSTIYLSSK